MQTCFAVTTKGTPLGLFDQKIFARQKTRHCKGRKPRTAQMEVKFGSFKMNPPRNHPKHKIEALPDIHMCAIHAQEKHPPEGEDAVEWMLLTNQPITTLTEACERVRWYSLRWQTERVLQRVKIINQIHTILKTPTDQQVYQNLNDFIY